MDGAAARCLASMPETRRIFSRGSALGHREEIAMTDRSYVTENEAERERLQALVARLTDQDLAHPMSGGWTIAGVLGHVAFWDQRIVALVDEWRRAGVGSPPTPLDEASHVDWINDASKPFLHAVAPRRAAELAVAIAEAADRAVASLPDEYVDRNAALGGPINLRRAEHRREHLDEIEAALRS
jgi:hypothetical protein